MSYHPAEQAAPKRLGRYELLGQLATGGMAEIHLARLAGEAGFEKILVVKRLLPELVASKAFVAMFLDEAKLVARLDHPNICEVHELGRDGAEYFIVMPFLDGVPAHELIARPRDPDRRAQLRVAAGVIAQACAGLHHAHELRGADGEPLGLVHRDVSPSNLFVTAAGVVKVLDFGIAKVRGAAETEAGTIKGKTQYMAPEQLLGEPLDRRADVFALGIVLYELATHQRLFKRASDYLAARAILEESIPRADEVDPAVPVALADVIARALARKPADRYPDAAALAKDLEASLAGVAGATEISRGLAEQHAEELTAQRTRQVRVLDDARSTLAGRPVRRRTRRFAAMIALGVAGAAGVTAIAITGIGKREEVDSGGQRVAVASGNPVATIVPIEIDAGTPDAAEIDAAPAAPVVHHVEHPHPPHLEPGTFSIESTPYATVYVDGHELGITPLVHKQLPAGHHKLRAVLPDGRTKNLDVDVPAGKSAKPINLSW